MTRWLGIHLKIVRIQFWLLNLRCLLHNMPKVQDRCQGCRPQAVESLVQHQIWRIAFGITSARKKSNYPSDPPWEWRCHKSSRNVCWKNCKVVLTSQRQQNSLGSPPRVGGSRKWPTGCCTFLHGFHGILVSINPFTNFQCEFGLYCGSMTFFSMYILCTYT